jgi:hypothetical protein
VAVGSLLVGAALLSRDAAASSLSDAAAAMTPGQWRELTTGNINAALRDPVSGGVVHILPYADKMHWDPGTNRVYLIGSDDPGDGRRFVAYDESTNAWVVLSDPWGGSGVAHQYGLADIDVAGRRLYTIMPNGDSGYIYNLSSGSFTSLSIPSAAFSCCGAVAYFPERTALIYIHGDTVRQRTDAGSWSNLSSSISTSYHAIAYYNPVNKLVVFGGGNDTNRTFYKLSQSGTVTTLRAPPISLESPRTEFVANPTAGNFLVFGIGQKYYSYDPVSDVWTTQSASSVPAEIWGGSSSNLLSTVAATISRYGVGFFTACESGGDCSVFLYKFADPPPMPNPPTALTAN